MYYCGFFIQSLSKTEMFSINGGRASLLDRVGSYFEDAGQWSGGFCHGLFADGPDECFLVS